MFMHHDCYTKFAMIKSVKEWYCILATRPGWVLFYTWVQTWAPIQEQVGISANQNDVLGFQKNVIWSTVCEHSFIMEGPWLNTAATDTDQATYVSVAHLYLCYL